MVFHIADGSLAHVEPMFRRISEQYLAMLSNDFFFRAKLNVMKVIVDRDEQASCHGAFSVEDSGRECRIELHVCEGMDEPELARVIAHELGHCLVSNMGVGIFHTRADGSRYVDHGITRSEEDGSIVCMAIEEGIVELLAGEIAGRASKEWKSGARKKKRNRLAVLQTAVRELAKCFGKPLDKMERLDLLQEEGKMVGLMHTSLDFVEVCPAMLISENDFWFSICRQSFGRIWTEYDRVMGEGAFERLNGRLDELYSRGVSPCQTAEERLLIALFHPHKDEEEAILGEIREFRRKRAQAVSGGPAMNDRRIAADSLKQVIDRIRKRCSAVRNREMQEDVERFKALLNKRSVWKSIPRAAEELMALEGKADQLNERDQAHLAAIRGLLNAACEVCAFYEDGKERPVH